MQITNEAPTGLKSELKIVPTWVWVLAGSAFIAAQVFFDVFIAREPKAPPAWARPLLGLLVGIVVGCYLLFLGYINRDAKRRGMSPTLWTIVAILIPNALGIILYFVLRQPLRNACPQCGNQLQPDFNFCPRCSYKMSLNCPQCQRPVGMHDLYCAYCGVSLRNPATPA